MLRNMVDRGRFSARSRSMARPWDAKWIWIWHCWGIASPGGAGPGAPYPVATSTACAMGACNGAVNAVTALRSGEFGASTPKYRCRCVRGGGTIAAINQLQRREGQLVCLGFALVTARLASLFGAVGYKGSALFAKAVHSKGWAGAIPCRPLARPQSRAVPYNPALCRV